MPLRSSRLRGAGQQGKLVRKSESVYRPTHGNGSRQHHRHLMPTSWQCMAERMHSLRGVGCKGHARHEDHARCAERHKALTRCDQADADCTRSIVARPSGNLDVAAHAPVLTQFGLERG